MNFVQKKRTCSENGKKVPRKHFFRGIFALGYKDSNLEMTESESFIYDTEKPVLMQGFGLAFSKSFSVKF